MPIPGKLVVYADDGQPVRGPVPVADSEQDDLTGSTIEEFDHHIWTQLNRLDFFNTWHDVRKHEPIRIVKPLDRLTTFLYRAGQDDAAL